MNNIGSEDEEFRDVIIARLRATDKLYGDLRKAIAEYERREKK